MDIWPEYFSTSFYEESALAVSDGWHAVSSSFTLSCKQRGLQREMRGLAEMVGDVQKEEWWTDE